MLHPFLILYYTLCFSFLGNLHLTFLEYDGNLLRRELFGCTANYTGGAGTTGSLQVGVVPTNVEEQVIIPPPVPSP